MAFSYDAGSTSPTYAGLIEFNGIRFNDGTFKSQRVPLIVDSAPVRDAVTDLPSDDGGFAGTAFYGPWQFDLEAWLYVPSPDDVQAALDYLQSKVNTAAGLLTMPVNSRGWSAARQVTARVAGQIVVNEPDVDLKKVPRRDFTIPFVAPDPRLYAAALQQVTVTTGTTLTNNGSVSTPFTVQFNGPLTNPQIDGPGAAGTNRIRFSGTIPSGHWVEVQTNPASVTGVTAYDDTGASAYGTGTYGSGISAFTATVIAPGSSSWTATADSGTGSTVVSFRDAWI